VLATSHTSEYVTLRDLPKQRRGAVVLLIIVALSHYVSMYVCTEMFSASVHVHVHMSVHMHGV
jgi:hypothetical protein